MGLLSAVVPHTRINDTQAENMQLTAHYAEFPVSGFRKDRLSRRSEITEFTINNQPTWAEPLLQMRRRGERERIPALPVNVSVVRRWHSPLSGGKSVLEY